MRYKTFRNKSENVAFLSKNQKITVITENKGPEFELEDDSVLIFSSLQQYLDFLATSLINTGRQEIEITSIVNIFKKEEDEVSTVYPGIFYGNMAVSYVFECEFDNKPIYYLTRIEPLNGTDELER